jgi:ribosomal protein S18 acetylase RimI-like enzyme
MTRKDLAMVTDWILRRVGPGDAEVVLAADVYDGPAVRDFVSRFLGSPEAPDPRNLMLVAEVGGRIEGFVTGVVMDHPDKPTALFINELGVNEAVTRRGIGRALLAAIRAEGRASGCSVTWVCTEADNLAACALYRSAGGEEAQGIVMYSWDESGIPAAGDADPG